MYGCFVRDGMGMNMSSMRVAGINLENYIKCLFLIMLDSFVVNGESENCVILNWSVQNKGFHREILYELDVVQNTLGKECKLIIKQVIPRNLFVNKDQLEDLRRLEKVTAVVNDFIDTELPEDVSLPHDVYILVGLNETETYNLSSKIRLPIHVRYHSPQPGGGFSSALLSAPELYVLYTNGEFSSNCLSKEITMLPCFPNAQERCSYNLLSYATDNDSLEILVPVGNSDHYDTVLLITYFVTIAGSIYISTVILLSLPKSKK